MTLEQTSTSEWTQTSRSENSDSEGSINIEISPRDRWFLCVRGARFWLREETQTSTSEWTQTSLSENSESSEGSVYIEISPRDRIDFSGFLCLRGVRFWLREEKNFQGTKFCIKIQGTGELLSLRGVSRLQNSRLEGSDCILFILLIFAYIIIIYF